MSSRFMRVKLDSRAGGEKGFRGCRRVISAAMSRVLLSGSPARGAAPGDSGQWRGARGARLVIIAATAVALTVRMMVLLRPGYLLGVTEYDDGVYFGSALRLASGIFPYRDYACVQPPGITVLLLPVALLAKVTGTPAALAVARVLTAAVGAAATPLAGLLVRHRGVPATLVTCGILAVYPAGISASHTVLLEPWLVAACLAGSLALFDAGGLTARPARLGWAGAAFGVAGAIKVWAVIPVLVIVGLCLAAPPAGRSRARRTLIFTGGTAAGFAVPVVPFAALAPRSFVDGVVVAQLVSRHYRPGAIFRLSYLSGVSALPRPVPAEVVVTVSAAITALAVCATAAAWRMSRRRPPALDWFALLTAAAVVAALCWPDRFYYHYAAFLAPFLALSLGLPLARLAAALTASGAGRRPAGHARPGEGQGAAGRVVTAAAALLLAVMAAAQFLAVTSLRPAWVPGRRLVREIPPGACVAASVSSFAIAADRFTSAVPGCAPPVDALATLMTMTGGRGSPQPTPAERLRVARVWQAAFARAQVVWLYGQHGYIPWNRELFSWFARRFRPVRGRPLSPLPPCGPPSGRSCHPRGGLYVRRDAALR